jgi:hypothetical protein
MTDSSDVKTPGNRQHFIPFRKNDVVQMCVHDGQLAGQEQHFRHFHRLLERIFHLEFHSNIEALKHAYAPIDPDCDTRLLDTNNTVEQGEFVGLLKNLLDKANYQAVTEQDLRHAMAESSMFKIRLSVEMSEFSEVLLFCRGESVRTETVYRFAGRFPKQIEFLNYERVVVYIRFRDDYAQDDDSPAHCRPGASMLKLFRNVPRADMEMLFPNTQVRMRLLDKLLIGIPAIVSGGIIATTKLAGSLLLVGSLIGFWLGVHSQPVELNKPALLVLLAGVGALGAYFWKQFNVFKNRKLQFMQSLTQNLYFKNLDNNAGVFYRLANDAEEEECKEALLAYYFLLVTAQPMEKGVLDKTIEDWFESKWQCRLDFDIGDALDKLLTLGLITESQGMFSASPLSSAIEMLKKWADNYFQSEPQGLG